MSLPECRGAGPEAVPPRPSQGFATPGPAPLIKAEVALSGPIGRARENPRQLNHAQQKSSELGAAVEKVLIALLKLFEGHSDATRRC
jgi:hypothetical protein